MFVGRAKTWGSSDVPPTGEPLDSFEYARTSYGDSVAFKRVDISDTCLLYTSPSPRDKRQSRMPSSA